VNTSTKQLIEKRANAWEQSKEILERAEKNGGVLSAEDQTQFDKYATEMDGYSEQIDRLGQHAERSAKIAGEQLQRADAEKKTKTEVEDTDAQVRGAYAEFLRKGPGKMDPKQKAVLRANQSTTDAEGGYGIPTTTSTEMINALRAFGGVEPLATVITTATGNDMNFPTNDQTGVAGEWLGEASTAATGDETIGVKAIESWKAGSKFIKVSNELLLDATFDIVGWVNDRIVERIGRLTNTAFTTGSGSSQPHGFVGDAAEALEAASDTAVTADEVITLQHTLDPEYAKNGTFMFNNTTFKALRQLKDGNSQYLWAPGLANGVGNMFLGSPYVVNQDMVSMASNTDPIAFGDFSAYLVRHVGGMTIKRLDERFADADQTAFIAFHRVDGRLLAANATTYNPIQVINMAT